MSQHPQSGGALFINSDKKTQNQPDFRGNVEVTREQINRLVEMINKGLEPKLQLSGWNKIAKTNGMQFISLSAEAYMKDEQAPQYPPQTQPQSNTFAGQTPQQPQQPQVPQAPQVPQVQPQVPQQPPLQGATPQTNGDFDQEIPFSNYEYKTLV